MDICVWNFQAPPDPDPRLLPIQLILLKPIGSLGFLAVVSRLVGSSLDSYMARSPIRSEKTFSLSGVLTIIYICIIGLTPGKSSIWRGRAKDGFPP